MADRVEIRSVTCPPNTLQAQAIETDLSFAPGQVEGIEIVIPPGHAGTTGLAIAQAHAVVIPAAGTTWIISEDEVIKWPVEDYLNNGSWSAFTYNLDVVHGHTWYIRFLVKENSVATPTAPTILLPSDIYAASGGA